MRTYIWALKKVLFFFFSASDTTKQKKTLLVLTISTSTSSFHFRIGWLFSDGKGRNCFTFYPAITTCKCLNSVWFQGKTQLINFFSKFQFSCYTEHSKEMCDEYLTGNCDRSISAKILHNNGIMVWSSIHAEINFDFNRGRV